MSGSSPSLPLALPYLAAVLDDLESGMLLFEGDRVVYANRAIAALLGRSPAELCALDEPAILEVLRAGVDDPPVSLVSGKLLATGGVALEEFEIRRPQRSFVRWVTRALVLPDGPGRLCSCVDITAEVDLAPPSETAAFSDALTGLPNRRALRQALTHGAARAGRASHSLSVLLVDADHFKAVNDQHGHDAGDAVLRGIADAMKRALRGTFDTVGRWGGEEFLVILPRTALPGAIACGERLRAAVAETVRIADRAVTVSIGAAQIGRDDGVDDVLKQADRKLYEAKAEGRNCVRG